MLDHLKIPTMLLAALCNGVISSAQPQGVPQTSGPGARIEGTVRSITGEPIPRATLTLRLPPPKGNENAAGRPRAVMVTADDQGQYVFPNLPPGDPYQLTARHAGYIPSALGGDKDSDTPGGEINLRAGQIVKGADIVMTPHGVVAGQLTDDLGNPVAGVQVRALKLTYSRGRRLLVPAETDETNDVGEYRIAGLPPGRYYLQALAERQAPMNSVIQVGDTTTNVSTYYPNVEDRSAATLVNINNGDEHRGMDIRMARRPTYSVSGRVVDAAGAGASTLLQLIPPTSGSHVMMLGSLGLVQRSQSPDGSFTFSGLTPGSYQIDVQTHATASGGALAAGVGRLEFTIREEDLSGLVLALGPGAAMQGTVSLERSELSSIVLEETGEPVYDARSGILGQGTRIVFEQTDALYPEKAANAAVEADGSFDIQGLAPGRYALKFHGLPDGVYVKSARLNSQDVTHNEINLTSGVGGELKVVLSDQGASIVGLLQDEQGNPQPEKYAVLWPRTQDGKRVNREAIPLKTDLNGTFQFQSLAPGDYYLAAFDTDEPGVLQMPEFLSQFERSAVAVSLDEGSNQAVMVELVTADKVQAAIAGVY